MIYLDSSALLKLLHEEDESDELAAWLTARAGTPVVSSELAKVEVIRACRRIDSATLTEATALLASLDLVPVSRTIIDVAANVGATTLRSLDALHLASALAIRAQLTAFIAYDHRLAEAASTAGLEPLSPGA